MVYILKVTIMTTGLRNQQGMALGYVFGLVALLAILGAMLVQGGGIKQSAVEQKRKTDTLVAQANLIRNALFLCRVSYPAGGASGGTDNTFPATTTDLPNSQCPGSNSLKIFGEVSEILYPKQLDGFTAWALTNDATGVSISTQLSNASDINGQAAIGLAEDELGEWQATATADTLTYYIKK